jgi:hypothetical protein
MTKLINIAALEGTIEICQRASFEYKSYLQVTAILRSVRLHKTCLRVNQNRPQASGGNRSTG